MLRRQSFGIHRWSQPFGYAFKDKMYRVDLAANPETRAYNRWVKKGVESSKAKTFKTKLVERKKAAYDTSKSNLDLFKANIYAIIDTLDVERTEMYRPTGTSTYCNVYTYDVVSGLGGYLPRLWWYEPIEKKMISGVLTPDSPISSKSKTTHKEVYGDGITREQSANLLNSWFDRIGVPYFGWERTSDMEAAQKAANEGHIVILNAKNEGTTEKPGHGHMTVVLPELPDSPAKVPGIPLQSQAGRSNHKIYRSGKWWNTEGHSNGHAWIYKGEIKSPLFASVAELGGAYG